MQRARVSNHPCHRLSVPAAKRFWCRHCMMVFEDAITRWRHSRSCRSGGFDNFVRRREIETQALQKMAETLDPDMVTPVVVPSTDGGAGCSKELCCFICRQRFVSLDEMREHVRYPCNKPTTLQRPSMTVYIEEPTFGTGIQHHYTESTALKTEYQPECSAASAEITSESSPHPVTVYMNESEQGQQDSEAKPTNIYVNEKGETVIEVENLDLNTKSGELSLAHLLTQLSQQGIVFDQQQQSDAEVNASSEHQQSDEGGYQRSQEIDNSQPTAVDAANTLTQLAGSAFRSANNQQETYIYEPPIKRIKSEGIDIQYPMESQEHIQVQAYLQKDEPADAVEDSGTEKYVICTSESEVISVVRADEISEENSSGGPIYQSETYSTVNVPSHSIQQVDSGDSEVQDSQATFSERNGPIEEEYAGPSVIMLQPDQTQLQVASAGQIIKSESSDQVVITQNSDEVQSVATEQVTIIEGTNISLATDDNKSCFYMPGANNEVGATLIAENNVASLLGGGDETTAIVTTAATAQGDMAGEAALLLPQIVSVTSSLTSASDAVVKQAHTPE